MDVNTLNIDIFIPRTAHLLKRYFYYFSRLQSCIYAYIIRNEEICLNIQIKIISNTFEIARVRGDTTRFHFLYRSRISR